ncbi:hypothetical protein AX16_001698 [Volvariella volvacea WC 439]|nr:hypothetical protein AX16_001698 [Volvariella volvacea WC 439]
MDNYAMTSTDPHFSQSAQRQQQWPSHLIPQHSHSAQPSFSSPPANDHGSHYSFYHQPPTSQAPQPTTGQAGEQLNHLSRTTALSLNLSSLSVTSPTNHSPITGPSASSALSPVTPISPSANPFAHPHHHHSMSSQFQFTTPDPAGSASQQAQPTASYDDHGNSQQPPGSSAGYDSRRTPLSSRSSAGSTASVAQMSRKRSLTAGAPPTSTGGSSLGSGVVGSTLLEESLYEEPRDTAMDLGSSQGTYNPDDMFSGNGAAGGSEGSGSPSGGEDNAPPTQSGMSTMPSNGTSNGVGGSMNILGKPMATNNFVTKLYQ